MKMMVPTLTAKEVTAKEYVAHWSTALDHAQVLCDRQIQTDRILAELKTHFVAMLHQSNSVRDGFVSTAHADLLERDAEDRLADAAALNDKLFAERAKAERHSQDAKADRIIAQLDGVMDQADIEDIAWEIRELARPEPASVNDMQEVLAMAHEQPIEKPMDVFQECDRIATGADGVTIKVGGTGTKAELMEAAKRDPMDNPDVKRVIDQIRGVS